MSIGELSLLLPLLLIMILAIGRISSFCLPSHKGFYKMILNTNNEEYLNSFVSQQPMMSCFKIETRQRNIFDYSEKIKERNNFTYGSWELEPPQFANIENEVVIYLLKEKYILNYEANEKFKEFSQNLREQVLYRTELIDYDRTDTRLVLFNKRNSKLFNFLTG